ncbi:MAG: DUF5813 family protein [Halobacteriales archaeon]|nr:DUF5813 family protein [Halobacteriales archaeon]
MVDRLEKAERALVTGAGFEREDGAFVAEGTPFEATVRLEAREGAVRYELEMELPTLDRVVAGETVADVVEDGWFETLERRLEDADGALRADVDPPAVDRDERAGRVTVSAVYESARPDHGAEDAAALVGYVEGTYMEGVIPGYAYREPVAGLLERARERSGA